MITYAMSLFDSLQVVDANASHCRNTRLLKHAFTLKYIFHWEIIKHF